MFPHYLTIPRTLGHLYSESGILRDAVRAWRRARGDVAGAAGVGLQDGLGTVRRTIGIM